MALPGEQHGFRKAENVQKALDGEFFFYSKVFGFEPADKSCDVSYSKLFVRVNNHSLSVVSAMH
jgi:hypothetical protein